MKRRTSSMCTEQGCVSPTMKKTKVQAQRKFAQGCSNYGCSAKIPIKPPECGVFSSLQTSQQNDVPESDEYELNNFSSLPTIDDFLTFLCFRETDVLPERLNYLNNPQLNVIPAKKSLKFSNSKPTTTRVNGKLSKIKKKAISRMKKKNIPEYKLRPRNIKNENTIGKSSRLLAKHNQRLRSKSVVKVKSCENKLLTLKQTNLSSNRLVSHSKPVMKIGYKNFNNRPLTRSFDKNLFTKFDLNEVSLRRVTRRNSTLNRDSTTSSENVKNVKLSKKTEEPTSVSKAAKEELHLVENDSGMTKPFTKSLLISLPKMKPDVTNLIMGKCSSVTVTRNTRSNRVLKEVSATTNTNTRPSRRTKEAATLYMEMLGKDLLCPDENFDDDNISISSFPELPNTEEHIRREKELKEMHQRKINDKSPLRKISTSKIKPSAKLPIVESSKIVKEWQLPQTDIKEKQLESISGLCTRSRQYNTKVSPSVCKKQSVKIIRTRIKNRRNLGFGRRNPCNDIFNKHVTSIFNKDIGRSKIRNEDAKTDIRKSVTIKKLSSMKHTRKKSVVLEAKKNNGNWRRSLSVMLPHSKSIASKSTNKNEIVNSLNLKIIEKKDSLRSEEKLIHSNSVCEKEKSRQQPLVDSINARTSRSTDVAIISNVINAESKSTKIIAAENEKEEMIKRIVEIKSKICSVVNVHKENNNVKNRTEPTVLENNENESVTSAAIIPTSSLDLEVKEMKKSVLQSTFHNKSGDTADVSSTNDYNMSRKCVLNRKITNKLNKIDESVSQMISISDKITKEMLNDEESNIETDDVIQISEINSSKSNIPEKNENKCTSVEYPLNVDDVFPLEDVENDLSAISDMIAIFQLFEDDDIDEFHGFEVSDNSTILNDEFEKSKKDTSQDPQQELVTSTKNADIKKSNKQKFIFSNTKFTKNDKPVIQSVVSSNKNPFNVESKKVMFDKTDSSASTKVIEDSNSCSSKAFSPYNENSVYAFEPDLPTTSPPFRRIKPISSSKPIVSNSIAVQVNFQNDAKLECSSSEETQVSSTTDCNDRVFYIPIQTSDSTSTLGVAVKLDTDGPNQKIIMSASLITNSSPTFTTSTHTTISTKSSGIETSCTQTDGINLSSTEQVKNMTPSLITKRTSDIQTIEIPYSSTSLPHEMNRKVCAVKTHSQSVRIVKLKNKKSQSMKTESVKAKPQSVKQKNENKLTDNTRTKSKVPPVPVGEILEAPTFYPTANEFNDPLEYIESIRSVAEKYGLCRIVPPSNFKPECKVDDEMRFTAYNHYIHKLLHRWGPNVKEMMAIKKFLTTQNIKLTQAPCIGGMEIDLPRLYQVVQQCGGLGAVIEKERWQQVADVMKIPKLAQDRITKLDDIYCKYLLPYDILSHGEREKLFEEVEKEWKAHLKNPSEDEMFDNIDECIVKGRTMPLSCFYRIARNTMLMCFGNLEGHKGPTTEKIEEEFWNHVSKRKSHICVHSGSIDSGTYGYGFSTAKNSTFRKHPWNLKMLTNNSASILRSLGPIMGITVPTLHVGMLYSACCWYRDPHGLPWVEYLHTGANKIWYGIPDEHSDQFKEAMLLIVPRYCRDKKLWLPSDTVMIPPSLLTSHNVPLSRVVQHPGQFIVVFPKAFTSSIATGYHVSESVYFAHTSWFNSAKQVFKDMQDSCEPSVFSLEQLLISIADDARPTIQILNKVLPLLIDLRDTEVALRTQLKELGLHAWEKLNINKKRKLKGSFNEEDNYECETCRANLFVSLVIHSHEQSNYCLTHAATLLYKKPTQAKYCKLMYAYTEEELETFIQNVKSRINAKNSKKPHVK